MTKEIEWLTMKQVTDQTGIRAATINRYKEDFSEFIIYRYNASRMLEFDSQSIFMLVKIYELYRDNSKGRMTTEKVREVLLSESQIEEEYMETIDITDLTTTSPPQIDEQTLIQSNYLISYLKSHENRFATIENQCNTILNNQSKDSQKIIELIMNQHLTLLSEFARSRMQEQKKKTFLQRIFGRKETQPLEENTSNQA